MEMCENFVSSQEGEAQQVSRQMSEENREQGLEKLGSKGTFSLYGAPSLIMV